MKHFVRRGIAICLLLAMLIGLVPSLYAAEDTVIPIENDDLKHAGEKILGYWINPSNFTISNANIDNLTNLGVTDIYVLVKGEAGSINTTALKNVISYASSKVRVHAWVMCARDNAYLKSHPTHAVYHFRVGYKNNAHSSSSSYYDSRNGFVDLRNTSYQKYFNGIVDDLEAIDGLDGIHLDTIRYGGDYYDWSTNLKNALGKSNYNTMAKTMCDHHGYTYAADSNGYYVFTGTKTADDSSMRTLINANGAVAKAYREYRMATVTNFVKSVRENLSSDMILTAACMPEPALSLYGKATYGQDFASMAPYVDYVQIMSYFGDYYFINNNTYDTSWPANICKRIAKEGCNVVAGIQGYAFVNEDSEGRNGMNPTGYESQKQAEAINDARREINGDPAYGGDILGSAVFRGGTSSQASVIYDPSAQTVTFRLVAGATAIKSLRIRLYSDFYLDKSKCTVSGKSYTYNGVTYTVTGTATNDYYHTFDLSTTINAYGTKTLTIPVCKSDGTKKEVDYNYNHFAAVNIYSSTSKSNSTYLPIYLDGYVNSAHKTCSFTKTTPQPATCLTPGYHLYTCATCGYDYSEYIPQLSHAYVAAVTAPTCTQDGFTTYTCKNGCNDSYIQDPVAALGHSYEMTTTEPTCTENGAKIYTCVRCADSYEEPIEALGHQYEAVVTEPDCENEGFTTYTCACGESYTDRFVPALGHNYTEERILEPTCTEAGIMRFTCACGKSYEEPIEALGHQYDAVVTEPDCENEGFTTYTCACGESYTDRFVPALGHNYTEERILEPTCTEDGIMRFTCACGKSYEEPIEALGHQYDAVVTEPDCENEGFTTYTCACGESYTDRFVPALGHNYAEERILEPTCTEDGIMRFTCACGKSYEEPIEALGHQYEAVVTEPDCENEGFTTYTCACGESCTGDYVAALGHSYRYTEQENEHLVSCTNCDLEFTEAHEPDGICCAKCGAVICLHTNERSVVDVDATCTQSGSASIFCADCDEYLRTEEMPAKGHDLTHYGYKLPTCTEPGSHEHWKCNVCEMHFTDASCEYELPPSYANKPALGHSHTYEDRGNGTHAIGCVRCEYYETDEHSFAEGKCICGAKEEPKFDAALAFRMNISVGAEMVVNYTFMTSAVSKYADFYLEVSKNVAGGEPKTTVYGLGEREALTATNHPVTGEALLYQAAYQGINAKEMGDSFCATLYAVAEDGTVFCGETVTASIRDFLLGKIEDSSSEVELKTMAVDMLKYGAAAQIRLGYDTEHLVTDGLTEEQLGYATQTLPEATDNAATDGEGTNVNTNITIGARVELSASTICWDVADPTTVRCVIADSKGRVLAEPKVSTAADVMFSALYSNVGARQMREIITVTFYSGDTAISKTLSWSVESYVAQVRAKANVTLAELNMVNALLAYGDSVAAYMTASGQ